MSDLKQYITLVDIIAKSKLLETVSESKGVVEGAGKIKEHAIGAVEDLGYTEEKINSDVTVLYELFLSRMMAK